MKFEIHFVIGDMEDFVIISGENAKDIRNKFEDFLAVRDITDVRKERWSVDVSDE